MPAKRNFSTVNSTSSSTQKKVKVDELDQMILDNLTEMDRQINDNQQTIPICLYDEDCKRLDNPAHMSVLLHPTYMMKHQVYEDKTKFTYEFLAYIHAHKPDDPEKLSLYIASICSKFASYSPIRTFNTDQFISKNVCKKGSCSYYAIHYHPEFTKACSHGINCKRNNHFHKLTLFVPVNRLYFLFLVSLYCNYNDLIVNYGWLPDLLIQLDEISHSGEFAINNELYKKLFPNCEYHGGFKIDSGYFVLSNSSIIRSGVDEAELESFIKEPFKFNYKPEDPIPSFNFATAYANNSVNTGALNTGALNTGALNTGGKKTRQNKSKKSRPKKTHKKRQIKHKKRHNKSKKLI